MSQKSKKSVYAILAVILLVIGVFAFNILKNSGSSGSGNDSEHSNASNPEDAEFDKTKYSIDEPGSPWWIVNKDRPLPEGYVPPDLAVPNVTLRTGGDESKVSRQLIPNLERMVNDAKDMGHDLMLVSGYRSYELQVSVYNQNVANLGQAEADRVSAKPGTSEHQTGLTFDIGTTDRYCELETCFGNTAAGRWIAENAHEYGFIIRYPEGKQFVTGYTYEPWHLRYVGKELATEMDRANISTLEEFFNL